MSKNKIAKCIIVDDNKVARLMLQQHLTKLNSIEIIAECESALEAKEIIESQEIDILFLDIEMPEMSGLDLLRLLKVRPLTILTTAKQGYAVEAFELNVVDYLVKPFTLPRMMVAVERAVELFQNQDVQLDTDNSNEFLFIKENKVIRKLALDSILWMEAKGDYVRINMQNKNYIVHGSLKTIEDRLSEQQFMRIHRSYIIALNKIDYIEDRTVYIHNQPIPISETYKDILLGKLNLL